MKQDRGTGANTEYILSHTPGMQGAHDVLVGLWRSLARAGQALPVEAMRSLALLHSYLLLRPLTALGEHEVGSFRFET